MATNHQSTCFPLGKVYGRYISIDTFLWPASALAYTQEPSRAESMIDESPSSESPSILYAGITAEIRGRIPTHAATARVILRCVCRTSIDLLSTTQTVERGVPVGVEVASHGELQKVWDDVVGNYKFSTYV